MRYSFLFALIAALAVAIALPFTRGPATALAFPGADGLYVSEACNADGTLQVHVGWTTYDTGEQWLDLAQGSDTFEPGTYTSYGPAAPGTDSVSWRGFAPAEDYTIRIVTATSDGWTASTPVNFTTRACPIVIAQPVPLAVPVLIAFTPPGPTCPGCPPVLEPSDPAEALPPPTDDAGDGSTTPSDTGGTTDDGTTGGETTDPVTEGA